jgi:endonuclease/exonuclease/phosphatase family metal-dependent hydrolase
LAPVRVLTWNLFHGRAVPPTGRDLRREFAQALGGWEWDVALLQEVPPWWPACLPGNERRQVLTSRNWGLALRRWAAVRWPDAIKSNGGGCNAILVRGQAAVTAHRAQRLSWLPERRWVHAVRLAGLWVANTHTEASAEQGRRAASSVLAWAQDELVILGGDFNVPDLELPGLVRVAGRGVDQIFTRGLRAGPTEVLARGPLSDHAPVVAELHA